MRWLVLAAILAGALLFPIKLSYEFVSSNLVLKIEGKDGLYDVRIGDETYESTGTLIVPWKKGRIEKVTVIGKESGETAEILVKGVKDEAPRVYLEVPKLVGMKETKVKLRVVDDWDESPKVRCFVDEVESPCDRIDPLFLDGEKHVFEVRAKDSFGNTTVALSNFTLDSTPPGIPRMNMSSPEMVIFPDSPTLKFLLPDLGTIDGVNILKRDKTYVLRAVDEAGNPGTVFVIPSILKDLTPFPIKAITSIQSNYILLGPGSYSVIGKVLVPQSRSVMLGKNVTVNVPPTSELIVKGTLHSLEGGTSFIGGGGITLMDGGELLMRNVNVGIGISAGGGKLLYMEKVDYGKDLEISRTDFVVINETDLESLECEGCGQIYLMNSRIPKINVRNISSLSLESVEASSLNVSGFVRVTIRNSTVTNLSVDTFSRVEVFSSKIGEIFVDAGSRLRLRDCGVDRVTLQWFSKMETHSSTIGKIEEKNSEVIER